jgi:hypothetical protein
MPSELFTLEELVTISQVPSLPTDIATLARELVTIEIRQAIGATLYDSLTDVTPYKAIALGAAKRGINNALGLRATSERIDDYEYTNTFATETLLEIELTDAEIARIRKRAGLKQAFSIAAAVPVETPCCIGPYGCAICQPNRYQTTCYY